MAILTARRQPGMIRPGLARRRKQGARNITMRMVGRARQGVPRGTERRRHHEHDSQQKQGEGREGQDPCRKSAPNVTILVLVK